MTLAAGPTDIDAAARRLVAGGLVAFPTETVYGLGADAENPAAIAGIYAAKGRPSDHPVIVHLAPGADLAYWAKDIPDVAYALAEAFWPGPLTLILPRADRIPDAVSGGQDTVGLRCPSHPVAQQLLAQFARLKGGQGGVAAPSANKFGQVSPTTADHVRTEFPELDDSRLLVLDGGAAQVGIESTILDVSRLGKGVSPALLRPGHISAAQIADVIGVMPSLQAGTDAPRVSGSLKAHYAPHTPLVLLGRDEIEAAAQRLVAKGSSVVAVGFGNPPVGFVPADTALRPAGKNEGSRDPGIVLVGNARLLWVQAPEDPHAYAHALYAQLRAIDTLGADQIMLERPPETEAWRAVNDRIGRAAAAFGG